MTPYVPELAAEDKLLEARVSLVASVTPLLEKGKYIQARGVIDILERMDNLIEGVVLTMAPSDRRFTPEEVASIKSGAKIDAIKQVRQRTGLGLKEAKDLVESYVITNP